MSKAIRLLHGDFGRVALLEMNAPLVTHAHHHCHILLKAAGPDTTFRVSESSAPLTDGNAVLVNAWEPHAYVHNDPADELTIILALYLEPTWLGKFSSKINQALYPKFFERTCSALKPNQKKLIETIVLELWWSDSLSLEQLESMLAELSLSFLEGSDGALRQRAHFYGQGKSFMDPRIRRAIGLLRENPDLVSDMGTLATAVQLSRSHFFELFRRCTGLSPVVYANALKMEQAFQTLAEKRLSMDEISSTLGFSAQSHFTRFFKQHQGVVPSHYRRQLESKEIQTER